jgi:pSer/pThr/pTyr-binding forkhead associated (FHA) protein
MWKLQIVDDDGQRSEIALEGEQVTIGRQEGNTIRLPERNVSRLHARLVRDDGRIFIEDAGSSFGTRINGSRIDGRIPLTPGDEVVIGDYHLLVWYERDGAQASPLEEAGTYQVGRAAMIPMDHRARFVVLAGALSGIEFSLDRSPLTLGRSIDCGLRIDHPDLRAEEAVVTYDRGTYFIAETAEGGRVRLNGEVVQSGALRSGDRVEFGDLALQFVGAGETYLPALDDDELDADAAAQVSSGAGRKAIFAILVLTGIGLVGYWYFYVRDASLTQPALRAIVAERGEPSVSPDLPEMLPESELPPSRPEPTSAMATPEPEIPRIPPEPNPAGDRIADHMTKGTDAMTRREWADAIEYFDLVLESEPEHLDAKAQRERADVEAGRALLIESVRVLIAKGELPVAWERWKAETIPETSVYVMDARALDDELQKAYAAELVESAQAALDQGDARKAGRVASRVLEVDRSNERGAAIKASADKIASEQRKADAQATAALTGKGEGEGSKPSGLIDKRDAAKQLYSDGRTAKLKGNTKLAIDKFTEAVELANYPQAHKQLGIIYAETGDAGKAVRHYEKYLSLAPSAGDAASVRMAIQSLGGSR